MAVNLGPVGKFINDGGPAFPKSAFYAPGTVEDGLYNGPEDGMSLRDYVATKALQGILSQPANAANVAAYDEPDVAARWAYDFADAMLRARKS